MAQQIATTQDEGPQQVTRTQSKGPQQIRTMQGEGNEPKQTATMQGERWHIIVSNSNTRRGAMQGEKHETSKEQETNAKQKNNKKQNTMQKNTKNHTLTRKISLLAFVLVCFLSWSPWF